MKLVTQRGIKMKKTIIYYLVTAAMLLSLSSCGEKADDSSSEAEKTETKASVTSKAETISENEPVSEPEPEINLGFNGEFNEEVFEKICQNVKIGDKIVSIPCTLNDLGDDYSIESNYQTYENYITSALFFQSKRISEISFEINDNVREGNIVGISIENDPIYDESITGNMFIGCVKLDSSKEEIITQLGNPTSEKAFEDGTERIEYKVNEKKYISIFIDSKKNVVTINLTKEQ